MLSYFVYNSILLVSCFFAWLATLKQNYSTKVIFLLLSFFVIFIPVVLRFDVGPDYAGYVGIFEANRYAETPPRYIEKVFFYIIKAFKDVDYGYVFVLGIYAFFSLLIIYIYSGVDRLPYVLFLFITMSVGLFTLDDQVRQFLAICIWLLSLRFIIEHDFIKYSAICLLASLFHFSAIMLIPFYFLARITLPVRVAVLIFFAMVFVFYFDLSAFLFQKIFSLVPYYNKYSHQVDYISSGTATSTGLGVLLNLTVFMLVVVFKNRACHHYLSNLVFIGIVIMLFSAGNLNLTRFAKYFLFLGVFQVAQLLSVKRDVLLKAIVIVLMVVFFERAILNRESIELSYQTVFSENFKNQILRRY